MRRILALALVLAPSLVAAQGGFVVVEQAPELIGGLAAIRPVYPDAEWRAGVEGRVMVAFYVEEDGSVSEVTVTRGLSPGLDAAAVEAVRPLRFRPGVQRGRPVRVQFSLPVTFRVRAPEPADPPGLGAGWTYLRSVGPRDRWVRAEGGVRTQQGRVLAWVGETPRAGAEAAFDSAAARVRPPADAPHAGERIGVVETQYTIDCRARALTVAALVYRGVSGAVVAHAELEQGPLALPAPGSAGEALVAAECRTAPPP